MRAIAIVLVLLAAGCVAPTADLDAASAPGARVPEVVAKLSPILGDLDILHEVLDIETPHGLVNVDLYKPDVEADRKLPVILVASPYNNRNGALNAPNGGKNGDDNWVSLPLYEWMREDLLPRGYAFAQMDILGTRNSGGCQGIMNAEERQATAAVIDWLGSQEWSNGKVGMIGKSYLGLSQMGAAVERPEHLATIVPISGPTHDYAYHFYNGVPYRLNILTNPLYLGGFSSAPPDGDPATYTERYPERYPCMPEAIAEGANPLGDYSARWQERDYRPLIPEMSPDVSVMFIHGHQDWNVKPDHTLDVYDRFPGHKMAILGQWAHDYPNRNNADEDRWGERDDWYFMLHRWFDHWLLGIDTGLLAEMEACPVQTQGSDATWRCTQDWPPKPEQGDDVTTLTLHPQDDDSLASDLGSGTRMVFDGGDGERAGRHFFWTEPLLEDLRVVGVPNVTLRLSTTSAYNAYATVALGFSKTTGPEPDEITWGFQSLRHRDSIEQGTAISPNTMYDITFGMYPVDHVFHKGERIAFVLRGQSDGPNGGIALNPVPGMQTIDLAGVMLQLPTMPLDRTYTPVSPDDLPGNYLQEDE